MASKKKSNYSNNFRTPRAYLATGVIMWIVGYVLFLLATDSASTLQWIGFFVAVIWGAIRIVQSVFMQINSK